MYYHSQDAQATHKNVVNHHRLNHSLGTRRFQVGHRVWLLKWNVQTKIQCDYLRLGPFEIYIFHLDLPSHMQIHLMFHVSRLEPCSLSSIHDRLVPRPPIQLVVRLEYNRINLGF